MSNRNYWGYRIDTSQIKFFFDELTEGRLRQGWGWDEGQNLKNLKVNEGAGRNRPMLYKVKKGDILLIPQLPHWGEVAIVEATEDWFSGYKFEIDKNLGDYGHIFPARFIKKFSRHSEHVTGNIRSTLKNFLRFWNMNHYSDDVEKLLLQTETELVKTQNHNDRLESSIGNVFNEVFDEKLFADKLFSKLSEQFNREEWEFALVYGLKKMFPFYQIERVGGKEEKNHGTDILIRLPSLLNNHEYAIAVQIKDYAGNVSQDVIHQINKAQGYWDSENLTLIEKIVIITKAIKTQNAELLEHDKSVKFIFAAELKQILSEIGKSFIGMK